MPSLLVDLREGKASRGFHVLAALQLCRRLAGTAVYRIGGERPDEAIAVNAFQFDTGVAIARWHGRPVPWPFFPTVFVAVWETMPTDRSSRIAWTLARHRIIGALWGLVPPRWPATDILNGHDTEALAQGIDRRLSPRGSRQGLNP